MSAYATEVWNAAFELVRTLPGFTTVRQNPMDVITPAELPCLQCFMLRDQRRPDGDANAGEPRFIHHVTLGFEGVILASDAARQLTMLDAAMNSIDGVLLTNAAFAKMVEGFEGADCKLVFARIGETPIASYQLELVVSFRSQWPPVVADDLHTIHVETKFPAGGQDSESTIQIVREYDVSEPS